MVSKSSSWESFRVEYAVGLKRTMGSPAKAAVTFLSAILIITFVYLLHSVFFSAGTSLTDEQWVSVSNCMKLSVERREISKQYPINPDPCEISSKRTFLLLIVTSRVDGSEKRKAVRLTWGSLASSRCGVRLLFMIGSTRNDSAQNLAESEAAEHKDIIQSNQFDDSYTTLTAKSLHLLQWAATFCPGSEYTAKSDDDNWLNLPYYVNFLRRKRGNGYAHGGILSGIRVERDPNVKWFVPKEEYQEEYYPDFLAGGLYAFPTRSLSNILANSLDTAKIMNEDVHISGILAGKAGVKFGSAPTCAWEPAEAQRSSCPKWWELCIQHAGIEDIYNLWRDPCFRYEPLCWRFSLSHCEREVEKGNLCFSFLYIKSIFWLLNDKLDCYFLMSFVKIYAVVAFQ